MTDDYRKFFDNFSMYKDDRLAIIIIIYYLILLFNITAIIYKRLG